MKKIFAHKIIFGEEIYEMHVAHLLDDGSVEFFPFKEETSATVFVSGTIRLSVDENTQSLSYEPTLNAETSGLVGNSRN